MTTVSTTMTPTDATIAVLGRGPDLSGSSAPSAAADFLAAIVQALTPGHAGAGAGSSGAGAAASAAGPAAAGPDAAGPGKADATTTDPTDTAQDAAALGLVVPGAAVAGVAVAGVAVAAAVVGVPTAAGQANVAAGADAAPTGPTSDIRMPVSGAGAAAGTAAAGAAGAAGAARAFAAGQANVAAGADGAPTSPTSDIRMPVSAETTTTPHPATDAAAAPAPADQGDAVPDPAQNAPQPPPAMHVAPASAAAPAHAAPPTGPAAGPAAHVTRQVFPEVTSLVTRGDGTHRITLTLKPEALGEVRVVMTVRDGAVHVRLAAGHEAQQSLLEGSHELSRLLESAGASETRVVVRDLGTPPTPTAAGPALSQGLGDPRPQDQHAGTRAQHPATDGTNDTRTNRGTTGANPPRSVEPVTRTRIAGVDVTM